jgi:ribosomal protein L11 methyltransferase
MTEENEHWYRLELLVESQRAEDAASMLWEFNAAGVEVQDRETYADDETIPPVPEGTNRLVAFFLRDSPSAARGLEQEVVSALTDVEIVPISVQCALYTDKSWETAWKEYFKPALISPRAIVGPPWEDFEAPEGGTKIVIEPGMAFGTGTHETTQLCAEKIDRLIAECEPAESKQGPSVLDVGCGSAILSMIARRLGADPVEGIDVDKTAVEVAQANLKVNDLAGQIELSTTPVDEVEGTYDIVVANILTHILLHIREGLIERVAPGGVLLLSGITDEQVDEVRQAFVGGELEEVNLDQKGEWVCFELRRKLP